MIDRNGNTTNYAYDGQGRLTTITDPMGLVTTLAYSGDRLASVTDPAVLSPPRGVSPNTCP
ncbi:MAG: RHS repeat protein [Proteobacteria bacterium]|nr:RHS repeat protein [Pseudomonadota bacterium]